MNLFDHDPSLVGTTVTSDGTDGEFGPYSRAIEDFLERRIPNALSDPSAVEWWASQTTSYWRNWAPARKKLWGDVYTSAKRHAKASGRLNAWKRARDRAREVAYFSGYAGASELTRAVQICVGDAVRGLTVVDLVDVSVLLEPFHSLEYGPNFHAVRDLIARRIPSAVANREYVERWRAAANYDLESRRDDLARAIAVGAVDGLRPGCLSQGRLAGGAAFGKAIHVVPPDLEDRDYLFTAILLYGMATGIRPLSDDSLVRRLEVPLDDLFRVTEVSP